MSLQVATIRQIPIKLHFSLILVFFLISWTLAQGFMPQYAPGLSPAHYWLMSVSGTIILFFSVLIHELSHSMVARSYGIRVKQIMLFIFGGISDIEEEPKEFRKEFKMAIAGPAVSLALSLIFASFWWLTIFMMPTSSDLVEDVGTDVLTMLNGVIYYSAILNLILGVFNLIPAFPMDGGRILRSLLYRRNKNYDKSTRIAVKIGIIISYLFFGLGLLTILSGSFVSGFWIILIGWFLQNGAQSYIHQYDIMKMLSRIRLADLMKTNIISIPENTSVSTMIRNYFNIYMKSSFPVTKLDYQIVGLVTLKSCTDVPEAMRDTTLVGDIMIPKDKIRLMNMNDTAEKALSIMINEKQDKIFVCNDFDIIEGIVSKTDLIAAMDEKKSSFVDQDKSF
ncbi:MAG: site-2 protease family protein [Candidatus Nitrosocosmicus sp.]|uniref:site-2 protease family protein n=1 Tax=Candidatus Nitrosocosmicus agrestis TaxID=2563600 RepID=UPI00122E8339|nr:site-2 protease family protein [Candidatus Nitrosocosmicus sp. SS]KAA2280659.1 CBS domain-containing protein [Candidatus Nitrosocosmicus sp. SS]KAF0869358.1 CBS domain-containing protein [Candidatus Nitrosocosmicus sp. SS]MDR4492690.1 site-2 protease family protein [Candidatus Nitrosocosmicus sp.]